MAKAKKTAKKTTKTKPGAAKTVARDPREDERPDASAEQVVTWARRLAKQALADLAELTRAKVDAVDAHALESGADALDQAQTAWFDAHDARSKGTVATLRVPLRAGRDQLFHALRTFADGNASTQKTLDDIGDVTDDDDLARDTTRLLSLAKKHHADLAGTDVTAEALTATRKALEDFKAARAGGREGATKGGATAQAETEALRKLRRARNVAFWSLAELGRRVCKRGQYAFRTDKERRAKYVLYSTGAGSSEATATTGGGGGTTGGGPPT